MAHSHRRSGRTPILSTAQGSRLGSFGVVEWALLSGVALIWGSSYLLIDIGLEGIAPTTIAWMRSTLGFVALAAFPAARRPVDRADWWRILVLGMTWLTVPFLLFPIAQQHIDSALAGMLNALIPIHSAAMAAVLLRSLPRLRQMLGISLGLIGAISIGLPAVRGSASGTWGVLLVLSATLLYGLSLNVAVTLQQRYGAPAVMVRAMGVAAVATAPTGLAGLADSRWESAPIIAVTVLGLVNTGAAFSIMTAFVGRVGPTRGTAPVYFLPVVAMMLGVVFRDETVLPLQVAGTGVVLLGAWLTSGHELQKTAEP